MKSKLYIATIVLATIPTIATIFVFLLWFATRAMSLIVLGIYGLPMCFASTVLSFICLSILMWQERARKKQLVLPVTCAILLMGLSIPVEAIAICSCCYLKTQYVLTVENDSPAMIEDIRITMPDEYLIGQLSPRERVTRRYRFARDGVLEFSAKTEGRVVAGVIEGYVTHLMGGQKRLIFLPDRQYRIQDER